MSEWKRFEEDGRVFWIHSELGTVFESDGKYIAMVPKVISLGPYEKLEQAMSSLEVTKEHGEDAVSLFNDLVKAKMGK